MQKPQIHWKFQTPSHRSIQLGWKNLSQRSKLWLLLANLLWLSLVFYHYSTEGRAFMLITGIYTQLMFTLFFLHAKGFPRASVGSLIEVLKVENNRIYISDYPLPETVRKVVIGRFDIQGPAFLQLAWNQGHQWIFHVDELQQVRYFFRQHAPQIEILNE
ncbi:hypothetical protein EMM73_17740 [Rheinheimera sediminis]|uniref:hypothetical protein n=1 Tax=Rheinheimera sp. YQF-1 TaxID=2499626 RepID=UPI000FDC9AD1|nr:hypothetical protein [Rheinheimera sp. YQF-1]RVT43044.1 hypothetical protein EMM73_17740 [Rheinheimera sp. YQF-1]